MSKENINTTKKEWYKSAVLPWVIIGIVTIGFAGTVLGWTLRSNDYARVKGEANSIASQVIELSKSDSQK